MCGRHGSIARGREFAWRYERVFKKEPVRLDGRGDGACLRMGVVALDVQASFGFALRTRVVFSFGWSDTNTMREGLDDEGSDSGFSY